LAIAIEHQNRLEALMLQAFKRVSDIRFVVFLHVVNYAARFDEWLARRMAARSAL
jgi:hypothetical protein